MKYWTQRPFCRKHKLDVSIGRINPLIWPASGISCRCGSCRSWWWINKLIDAWKMDKLGDFINNNNNNNNNNSRMVHNSGTIRYNGGDGGYILWINWRSLCEVAKSVTAMMCVAFPMGIPPKWWFCLSILPYGSFLKWGDPTAGWFMLGKIPIWNGWWLGVPLWLRKPPYIEDIFNMGFYHCKLP